ncbi:hypothetical protein PIB30_027483 [Stylosanthes scabra]|uniref:KIB1-4 beta-propeller domain-containing protein n=1 Tax=Stylosanthes scabra TaxID=79078 RepID=A0ABU6QB67_9FABA|nr:hypothetical protein [Stylosanthes scabra]
MDNLMNCRATCRSWRKVADAVFTSKLPLMLSLSPPKRPHSRFITKFKSDEPNLASLSAPWSNDDESSTVLTGTWPQAIDPSDIIRVQSVQGTPRYCQVRVVFNSAPPRSEEFVVVFLCVFSYEDEALISRAEQVKQRLAFIRFKQGSWMECIVEYNEIFYDIAVDDHDKLYALTFEHDSSVVFVLTLDNDHGHVTERLVIQNPIEDTLVGLYILTDSYYKRRHQLDTSTGELLLVCRERNLSDHSECYESNRTNGFYVCKLERSSLTWCEVLDIGDRFLLWDYTRVSFVSAKGLTLPKQFKGGNCILFCHANTLWDRRGEGRFQFQDHDMGVFSLADRTITYFPNSSSLPFSYQNMWFSPAPMLN